MSAACVSKLQSFWSFPTSPNDGQTRLLAFWINPKWRQNLVITKMVIFTICLRVSVCINFFGNACISQISHRSIEIWTLPLATVAINANRSKWIIIWNSFWWFAQQAIHTVVEWSLEPFLYICTSLGLLIRYQAAFFGHQVLSRPIIYAALPK